MSLNGSAKELAEILDLSERRVNQIANDGKIFSRDISGNFNIPKCVESYFEVKFKLDDNEAKKLMYDAELKKQKAEEAELKNGIARGEYVRKDDVTSELQRFFIVLKRSLIGISRRVALEVNAYVDTAVARKLEKSIAEIMLDALEQMSIDGIYKAPKIKK